MRRLHWSLALGVIFLVAFALRVFRIESQSLWYDEAFSVYLAHMGLADITARTAADIQPPLYYYLLHLWMILAGDSEFAVRFLSLFFGVLTIPLIYAMAQRLVGRRAALLTALLAMLSPLYLWYSQEARMYTLITFLLLLSSYLLLRIMQPAPISKIQPLAQTEGAGSASQPSPLSTLLRGLAPFQGQGRIWLLFALINIAAVYTHYFAFAVIGFQFLVALGYWALRFQDLLQIPGSRFQVPSFKFQVAASTSKPENPPPEILQRKTGGREPWTESLKPLLAGFAAIPLAYVPWTPFVAARLGQDASYWQGALKLDEAIRHISISFTTGESVLEGQAQWIAAGWFVVLIIGLVGAAFRNSKLEIRNSKGELRITNYESRIANFASNHPFTQSPNHPIVFLVLYLIIPVALLLLLFYRNPKFNARYLMIASPPFFMLLGVGLASLLSLIQRGRLETRVIAGGVFALVATFCLVTFAFADWGAYFDPAFTKADFRGVARYVERHIAPDEAIILSSGHLFPAFGYYYRGDAPQIRLPDDPTLNTEHVLGFEMARVLNQTLTGKRGAWVVLWQDEVVDPNGFLPFFLSSSGKEQAVEASFYQVRLRHWVLPVGAHLPPQPQPGMPRPANFSNKVQLLGFDSSTSRADQGVSFTLYWQTLDRLREDYQVALRVVDASGNLWGKQDRRPAGYNYPATRWKKGEYLFGTYTVPLLPAAPAGNYFVEASFYTAGNPSGLDVLASSGAPIGKSVRIGPLSVLPPAQPVPSASLHIQKELSLSLGPFTLLGYHLGRDTAGAGERIPLTLFWRADTAPSQDYTFQPVFGKTVGERLPLANAQFPTSQWRADEIVRGQYLIPVPASVPDGATTLGLLLSDGSRLFDLAPFTVEKTDRVFVAPEVQFSQSANFGNSITLTGYTLPQTAVKPGETLKVTLVWQAREKMDRAYTVFVHLLDSGFQPVAQKDSEPMNGARATTGWAANEYLADTYDLIVKPETPAGKYTIEVGWYDAKDPAFARLPVLDESGAPTSDHVILQTAITVGP